MENIESIKEFVRSSFPNRLKTLRETIGVSQETFAKRLGVSRAAIGYYEKGERIPDILFLEAVRELTGCSLNFLLGYSDNMMDCDNWSDFVMDYDLSDRQIIILQSALKNTIFKLLLNHEEFLSFLDEIQHYSVWFTAGKEDYDFIAYKTISSLGNLIAKVCEEYNSWVGFSETNYIKANEIKYNILQEEYKKLDTISEKVEKMKEETEQAVEKNYQDEIQAAKADPFVRFRLQLTGSQREKENRNAQKETLGE